MNSNQIVASIQYKEKEDSCSVPQDYFVGITSNPKKRLFKEHKLNVNNSFYTYFEAHSKKEAKKAFDKLIEYDMNGFVINEKIPGKYVYCYFVDSTTVECCAAFE